LLLQFVQSVWLNHLVLQLCVQFHSWKWFSHILLLELVEKTKETYVLPLLNDYLITPILIYGCPRVHMMCLPWSYFLWDLIGNQNK
jgi:hypothetical protein